MHRFAGLAGLPARSDLSEVDFTGHDVLHVAHCDGHHRPDLQPNREIAMLSHMPLDGGGSRPAAFSRPVVRR